MFNESETMTTHNDPFNWDWEVMCGPGGFVIWSTEIHNLGLCFQELCLHLPVLLLLAVCSAYYFGKQSRLPASRHKTCLFNIRKLTTLILAVMPVLKVCIGVPKVPHTFYVIDYLMPCVESLTWLMHFCYVFTSKRRNSSQYHNSPSGQIVIYILWTFNVVVYVISIQLYYLWYLIASSPLLEYMKLSYGFSFAVLVLQSIYGICLICDGKDNREESSPEHQALLGSPRVNSYSRFREEADPFYLGVALEGMSFFSKLFFLWVNPLMDKGLKGKLNQPDDLHDLPVHLTPAYLSNQLEHTLHVGKQKMPDEDNRVHGYGSVNNGVAGHSEIPAVVYHNQEPKQKISLFKALHSCFGLEFYSVGILKLIADCSCFVGPILLNKLVTFVETKSEAIENGYLVAGGLFSVTLLAAFCSTHFTFLMTKVGMKVRGAVMIIVYRKTLMVSSPALSTFGIGEITNFMSTDTDRVVNACSSFHSLWSIPLQIAVSLYLLYTQVGLAFLAGVSFTIILIPINKVISTKIGQLSTKMMENKDKRVQMMAEVLRGITVLKFHVWEDHFVKKITESRNEELKYLKYRKYLDAMCVYFWATTPVLISIFTFTTYVLLGNKLTAATVFTSIALFNMLISPLNAFPWVLNGLTEAWVSLKRIQQLLDLPDFDLSEYYTDLPSENDRLAVCIRNGTFSWGNFPESKERLPSEGTQPREHVLNNISMLVTKGEFVGVTGRIGCGKSSLLSALLAELNCISGVVFVDNLDSGFGFVSQLQWLQHGSVKDNILFGKAYDHCKYNAVLDACCLVEDIQSFSNGDLENIGEGGAVLSGGQKARVALARAVYQDKDIYILDDVLAAVDARVAQHIFRKCITGLLRNKTRILCTHHLRYLMFADNVIVMEDGHIKEQGKPQDVLPDYDDFVSSSELGNSNMSSLKREDHESEEQLIPKTLQELNEEHQVGSIQWNVYASYWRAVGHLLGISILLSMFLMQASRNITDLWLSYWVSHTTDGNKNNANSTGKYWDNILNNAAEKNTSYYLTVYGILAGCNSLFTLVRAFLFAYGGFCAASRIHKLLLSVILKARITFFDITPLGRILNRFSSDTYIVDDSLPFIYNILLAQFFSLLGTMFVIVYGLPWLILLLAPLIPIYHWLQNHYRLTSRELRRIYSLSLSPVYSHFNETVLGLSTIRAFRATTRFKRESEEYLEANQKCQFASQSAAVWLSLRLQFIGVAMVTGIGVIAVLQHQFDVADPGIIGLSLSYALSITGILGGVVNAFTETEREMIAVERVDQYIKQVEPENVNEILPPPYAWPTQGVITFSNVVLRYRDYLAPALKGVSFETRPAEKIGVMGRTGAGKSSLLVALFRLCELTSGKILIDTVNIAHIGLRGLRSRLAIIPQDPFLFSGTIRDNLDPASEYRDAELKSAIQRCHMSTIVNRMGGLDAKLLPGGVNMSVGQRQLLCLVRAVLHNAKIICIDEATANVDLETDRNIQHTLRTSFRQSTVISIAHRASTVMDLDRVLIMGNGEVLEFDSPDVLMRNKESHFFNLASPGYELA